MGEKSFKRAEYTYRLPAGSDSDSESKKKQKQLELVPVPVVPLPPPLDNDNDDREDEDSRSTSVSTVLEYDNTTVSWASIDPTSKSSNQSHGRSPQSLPSTATAMDSEKGMYDDFEKYAMPIRIDVHEGETLYLPSGSFSAYSFFPLAFDSST